MCCQMRHQLWMGNDATQNHDDKTQNRNDATQSESNNFQGDAQDRWASFFGPDDTCHVPDDAEVCEDFGCSRVHVFVMVCDGFR